MTHATLTDLQDSGAESASMKIFLAIRNKFTNFAAVKPTAAKTMKHYSAQMMNATMPMGMMMMVMCMRGAIS